MSDETGAGLGLVCIIAAALIAMRLRDPWPLRGVVVVFIGYTLAYRMYGVTIILLVAPIFHAIVFLANRKGRKPGDRR